MGKLSERESVKDSGGMVRPRGVLSLDHMRKSFSRFYRQGGGGAAHFAILSGEKRRMLSEIGELSRRISAKRHTS